MKITLKLGGGERVVLSSPTARKTRDAYFHRERIRERLREGGESSKFDEGTTDAMLQWVVEAFDRQFTADEFLDGYQGWFFDILSMMDDMLAGVAGELDAGFPKPPKTAAKP